MVAKKETNLIEIFLNIKYPFEFQFNFVIDCIGRTLYFKYMTTFPKSGISFDEFEASIIDQ